MLRVSVYLGLAFLGGLGVSHFHAVVGLQVLGPFFRRHGLGRVQELAKGLARVDVQSFSVIGQGVDDGDGAASVLHALQSRSRPFMELFKTKVTNEG